MSGTSRISDSLHIQGSTVLVVDDNPADLGRMSDYLEEYGLKVLDARDGEEGIEKARRAQPDLILLNVVMPGTDGFETCRRLKADKASQGIPVILMLAPTEAQGMIKGFQLGAADYFTKPFQREEVMARVAAHLRLRRLTRELWEMEEIPERQFEERMAELGRANRKLRDELAERRRADDAHQESEEVHRITLENILDPVFITDDDGEFTFICTNVLHTLGYTMEDVQAMGNISGLVGEGLFNLEELSALGQIHNIERVIVDKQGRARSFLITVKQVSIKRGTILYACRDITERRRAERALAESRSRLHGILSSMRDPVFVFDKQGRFTYCYAPEEELYVPTDAFIGRSHRQVMPTDIDELFTKAFNQCKEGEAAEYEYQLQIGGETKWFAAKLSPLLLDDEFAGAVAVSRDTTKRKQAEEVATKHKEDLQRLSNLLLDAQEAERKRISLELHDELGQALTVIGMNLEELEKAVPPEVSPRFKDRLAETTGLADETLEQVREMALGLRPSLLDDLGLVPALRWYINRLAQRLVVEISFEAVACQDRLPTQVETALYRIVQEALTNIAKHALASRAHVHLECRPSSIVTTIEDDGQGFDLEATDVRGGVGLLGMRERVALLGGSLSIDSQPGRGTRLTLEIPRSEGA